MKKSIFCLLLMLGLSFSSIYAQDKKGFTLDGMGFYGVGFGVAQNSNEPDYSFRTQEINVLMNFDFGKLIGVSTGIGVSNLTANAFNSTGSFFHQRSLLRIPVLASTMFPLSETVDLYANGGFFYETITDDEFQYVNSTIRDVYDGSTVGAQFQIGIILKLPIGFDYEGSRAGVVFGAQLGSDYEARTDRSSANTQDLGDIYTISVIYSFRFAGR